ncbi:MAG: hypothetical protein K9W43_13395 [Candidatus Thorarchaeota archaeon]|nr:hypothetical protein [Candidatus Thorarchaeota archaeon]
MPPSEPPKYPVRISLPDAILRVMTALKSASSASIATLSRTTGLDRRTVTKVIDVILDIQNNLQDFELAKVREGRHYIIKLQERTEQAKALLGSVRRRFGRGKRE